MKTIHVKNMKALLVHASETIIENEPLLTKIDTVIGDGDHGIGMKRGFMAVKKMLEKKEFLEMDTLCKSTGIELLKSMGGASGVIFGTMFLGGISHMPHENFADLNQIASYFADGEAAIERRGKTKPGQKTMLDALMPAISAMKQVAENSGEIRTLFEEGYKGALQGMEASKTMQSRVGRSKNFHESTIGLPDPGAVSTSLIFKAFAEEIVKCEEC
ncbi:dihydroxyacetone kinase subunit DhaL [Muricomes intestini]|jgi:dihydroxyacetone kinase-like protein|uniref:phosphoenolpyruvate--glycerone phosphotransferase n=2 Tax=Muricomes intestini TaxID=1796634 RepID=A0A4R3KE88_9FIRM|nr:dihydroxyacetone kinase DhaL subunit [Muricomes intestini]HAX51071.1 dihydroxyacetone kinase subunit L [Lachnospiraceae bacterium]HCR83819.1 dihydroxyacetone kinase subunit L [Lachnospiraceae bacterium]